jgi:antitoxin component YwqK of YwqJK toxin-antitoxin module
MNTKDVISYNDQGQSHGKWLWFWPDGRFRAERNYINGLHYGIFHDRWYEGGIKDFPGGYEHKGNSVNGLEEGEEVFYAY